jgi:hypothetical protein
MFYKTEKEIAEDSDRQMKGWVFCLFVATPHKIELFFCISWKNKKLTLLN